MGSGYRTQTLGRTLVGTVLPPPPDFFMLCPFCEDSKCLGVLDLASAPSAVGSAGMTGFKMVNPEPTGDEPTAIFVTQSGRAATITVSFEKVPTAETVTLSPTEKISNLLAARADLSVLLVMARDQDAWKQVGLEDQVKIATLLAGKSVDLTTAIHGDVLETTLNVPGDVIRAAMIVAPLPH